MDTEIIIARTIDYVKTELQNAEGGHDWWHIERVWKLAKTINKAEKGDALVVELSALLHDIADAKFHNGDESKGPKMARQFLSQMNIQNSIIEHVVQIILNVSFKGGHQYAKFSSPELMIVQDADRLDAIGAIGIARTFNYGGYKHLEIHNPNVPPKLNMTRAEYKKSAAPTINHFYEKLLLLKDLMNTATGKKMAIARHQFMEVFLEQFYDEWDGKK